MGQKTTYSQSKGMEHGKPEIGDWSRIREEPELESFHEITNMEDFGEYYHDSEEAICDDFSLLNKL